MLGKLLSKRSVGAMSWPDYQNLVESFGFGGVNYMVPSGTMSQLTALQAIRNPVLLACILIRAATFSEIRFAFQNLAAGRTSKDLYGAPSLGILEHPWPGASAGDLLGRMEFDASMYGNSYWWRSAPDTLTWLDPTRMKILTGDQFGPSGAKCGKTLLAYQTQSKDGQPEETFLPGEIAHYRPIPDPDNPFRGLSWMSALLPDITLDGDLTAFKRSFLNNSATPNLVVQFTGNIGEDAFKAFRDRMETSHTSPQSAFKTLYLGAGADVKTVGSNWSDMELYLTQSYGEARLCASAGVPPALVGIVEGLKGSALNAGNYAATRRRFADITIRPLWRMTCSALETVAPPRTGSRLWYDDRDVEFVRADLQDAADVRAKDASTIVALTQAGYTSDSVVEAIVSGDWNGLKIDPNFVSVQLQPSTAPAPVAPDAGASDATSEDEPTP